MVRLEATDIGHRFGRNVLFRDLNLSARSGDSVAITGANGSGKSTLLHIIAGLLTPGHGTIDLFVDGHPVAAEDRPMHCGLVAPYLNVYDGFSAQENLRFIARTRNLANSELRIERAIEDVGLTDRKDDLVGMLSSGMKQRVKFAVTQLVRPPLLLLDEPSTNLDEPGREMTKRIAREHVESGGILLVATNDVREAEACDRSISVEAFRPVSSVRARPRQP